MKQEIGDRYLKKLDDLIENEFPRITDGEAASVDYFPIGNPSLKRTGIERGGRPVAISGFVPASRAALASVRRELEQADDLERVGSRIDSLECQLLSRTADLLGYGRHDVSGIFSLSHTLIQWYGCRLVTGMSPAPAKSPERRILVSTGSAELLQPGQPLHGLEGIDTALSPANSDGSLDLDRLCTFVENCYRRGLHADGMVLTLGQKYTGVSDPVATIQREITRLRQAYGVLDRPHIHVDIPLHWPLLLFGDYDAAINPLHLSLESIQPSMLTAADAAASDSCSIDLGSWGYTPLPLSLLIVKNHKDLLPLLPAAAIPRLETDSTAGIAQGADIARLYSLQALLASLGALGEGGLRLLAARSVDSADYLKERLRECGSAGVVHSVGSGPGVSFRRYHPDLGPATDRIYRAEIEAARGGDYGPLHTNSHWHRRQLVQREPCGLHTAWQPAATYLLNEPTRRGEPLAAEVAMLLHPHTTAADIDLFLQQWVDRRRVAEPPADY